MSGSKNLKETFLPINYETIEAKHQVIRENATVLEQFIKGLKQRKATVYTVIMTETISGFDGVITLTSLLLQVNLFCRKHKSLQLLKQINADQLTQAIYSFYDGSYIKMREYSKFLKEVFSLVK